MIFCDYYLPGYKSGGGMWTVVNLVEHFHHVYDFYIVTRNYDSKGDTQPFTEVTTDEWNKTGNAQVFYFSKKNFNVKKFAGLVNQIEPDAFFLNSAFALPVVKFLTARRKKLFAARTVILAPCGEFADGALSVKAPKKKLFLRYSKLVDLYRNICWKASFEDEKNEILKIVGAESVVFVAPDLAAKEVLPDYRQDWKPFKNKGELKLVFLSRLARKKNIHYLLEVLTGDFEGSINLDVVGPIEDQNYWRECLSIIERMPANVSVKQIGSFPLQTDALKKVSESHFFALPTLNENFGYVFIEGMAAGCPVLTSDRTVWNDLEAKNSGWQIPLENRGKWIDKIRFCLRMENDEYQKMSRAARIYALEWIENESVVNANRRVLEYALTPPPNRADAAGK